MVDDTTYRRYIACDRKRAGTNTTEEGLAAGQD